MQNIKLASYNNGTYRVDIFEDGTKVRSGKDLFMPEFPESIDLKVTNHCDLGCRWCHEKSIIGGDIANIVPILHNFKGLPAGVEIAIGGGDPMSYPHINTLVEQLNYLGLICNITINAKHLSRYENRLIELSNDGLIHGIGISWDGETKFSYPNAVCHVIAGVHSVESIKKAIDTYDKILILGYKSFGRGENFYNKEIEESILNLKNNLWRFIGKSIISFDNLALTQLEVKDFVTDACWKEIYMGDDGKYTMYYDAVKNEYAMSSIAKRIPADKTVIEFFKSLVSI